jgi:hypothetical protein
VCHLCDKVPPQFERTVRRGYNGVMRRSTGMFSGRFNAMFSGALERVRVLAPSLQLGVVVSSIAAVLALVLAAATSLSDSTIVLAAIVVAFGVSWVHSGRTARRAQAPAGPIPLPVRSVGSQAA